MNIYIWDVYYPHVDLRYAQVKACVVVAPSLDEARQIAAEYATNTQDETLHEWVLDPDRTIDIYPTTETRVLRPLVDD